MLPNIITIIRLISTIPLSIYIYYKGTASKIVFLVYILIIITDFLDGYIARHYNKVTNLGKILDPIVDKCLVIFTTIALLLNKTIPVSSLFIYIRDIIVAITGYYLMFKNQDNTSFSSYSTSTIITKMDHLFTNNVNNSFLNYNTRGNICL